MDTGIWFGDDSDNGTAFNNTMSSCVRGIYWQVNSGNGTIDSNTVQDCNNGFVGAGGSVDELLIINNFVDNSSGDGMYLESGTRVSVFRNNTVINSGGEGIEALNPVNITNNNLTGNTGRQLKIISVSAVLTDQSIVGSYEFAGVDLEIVSSSFGRLKFIGSTVNTGVQSDLDSDIQITNGSIFVDTTDEPSFNTSANITLYNTDSFGLTDRYPYLEGEKCNATTCFELTDADTYVFNVTGFSNYSVGEFYTTTSTDKTIMTILNSITINSTITRINLPINPPNTTTHSIIKRSTIITIITKPNTLLKINNNTILHSHIIKTTNPNTITTDSIITIHSKTRTIKNHIISCYIHTSAC